MGAASTARPAPERPLNRAERVAPRRRVLADQVYETLTAMVMDHEIAPDTKVGIDDLSRQLDVSPTPVREALARLESDGLVRKESLRGYFTTPLLSAAQLRDLFDFRRHVEPWAASRAAERIDPQSLRDLRAEVRQGAAIPKGSDYESYRFLTEHDARFHDSLFVLAGNEVMREAFLHTHCHLHLFRLYYDGSSLGNRALSEHRRITTAVASGDPDSAEGAMRAHLDASYQRLAEATT